MKDYLNDNFDISNNLQEKKIWVSPDLNAWSFENLENSGSVGADGALQE